MSKEDAQHTLGHIHRSPMERDAVHVAVIQVRAAENLKVGQHIGFAEGGYLVTASPSPNYPLLGIVDPYLAKDPAKGEQFWMMLYPNTITGLKHVWDHPYVSGDSKGVASASEKWLRDFADQVDADYQQMMYTAGTHCDDSRFPDYLIEGGKWEGQTTPDEFWTHFANVTGRKVKMWKDNAGNEHGPGIFSCSC